LIGELSKEANVVPIAYHVDYWNYLGWTDPFSSPAWTQRQMAYVHAFHLEGPFTPQAVVNGSAQLIGSDARGLRTLIHNAPAAEAEVDLRTAPGGRVHISASTKHSNVDVILAIIEDGIVTPVKRGENAGRSLRNDFVVRRMQRVGALPFNSDVPLELDPAWKNVRVVAFAQDRQTLKIYGASVIAIR